MRNDNDGFALTNEDPGHIGPYRLVGKLGTGGMGTVYAGVDSNSERVAIKVIHRELARDPDFRLRFSREAELLRRLNGRYTARVLSSDVETAQPWLATEYIPGPTLSEQLAEKGPLSSQELIGLAASLCEALRSLHSAKIVHRDLKPSNVILSPTGPYLIDMGIARALDETSVTRTGILVGSPGWISPEEYRGDEVGTAADIYGWALLLLFASSGHQPFGQGRPEVIATRIMTSDPDTSSIPESLRPLVQQALAKKPGERPSADQIFESLTDICRGSDVDSIAPTEVLTRFLDRTWHLEPSTVPKWSSPQPTAYKKLNYRFWTIICVTAALLGVLFVSTLAMQTRASAPASHGDHNLPALSHTDVRANPSPTRKESASNPPSAKPVQVRRTTPDGSYSYVVPSGWESVVDTGASGGSTCIRPKGSRACDDGVEITYGGHVSDDLNDYANLESLEYPDPIAFGCEKEDGNAYLIERELRQVGGSDAQYRKFGVSCAGKSDYFAYMWLLSNKCGQGTNTIRAYGAVNKKKLDSIVRSLSPCPDYS